jgi:2-polyprenyl-3-methyl-5-hydroxy-6-metoxy-1,4-benzoquinol methylase
MTIEERYRERYKSGDTPWNIDQPDFNLVEVVTKKPVLSCKVLDIGCGTGDNSIWLARNRFQVTGTDTSDIALDKAKEKAAKANVECDFMLVDFIRLFLDSCPSHRWPKAASILDHQLKNVKKVQKGSATEYAF